jgi:hypothetical protein
LRCRHVEKNLLHSGNKRYYISWLNSINPRLRDPLNRKICKIEKTRTAPPGSILMEWRCLEDKPWNLFDIYNFQICASATFTREIYTHRTKIRGTLQSGKKLDNKLNNNPCFRWKTLKLSCSMIKTVMFYD